MKVAILGCGQLARMMAHAAAPLEIDCCFVKLGGEGTSCVDGLGEIVTWNPGDSPRALFLELGEPNIVTVEREAIDVDLLHGLQSFSTVAPSPESVRIGQHRGRERALLDELDIPCAAHRVVSTPEAVREAVANLGLPVVLKSCESGYDGKLQWRFHESADVDRFCEEQTEGEWLIEKFVAFDREVSIVAARSSGGEFSAYPLTQNHHRDGILLASLAPAPNITEDLQRQATDIVQRIMSHLNYVGVLAVELFDVGGKLLVNELAPRVHNSGHWTMQEGIASQFENHMRAITGMPLGETQPNYYAGMLNVLGDPEPIAAATQAVPAVDVHLYNKSPKPLRKLGHLNIKGDSQGAVTGNLLELHECMYGAASGQLLFAD
ncbi:MAG: 5-(carboxyamino)imidazole ribonucleotide synthase [Pseudomonadota bacterium]